MSTTPAKDFLKHCEKECKEEKMSTTPAKDFLKHCEKECKEEKMSTTPAKGNSGADKTKETKNEMKEKKGEEQKSLRSNRPVRERKSVERLVAEIEDTAIPFIIETGRGTALKDIPNVAFKLSKKKLDESCKALHNILFGRRGKANKIRNNISQFSGFVWCGSEETQKRKIREKLEKIHKEMLGEFCDILDIQIVKSSTRKEDIITKLVDFLLAPHATTDVLLAEKEKSASKGTKRKRVTKSPGTAAARSSVKTQKNADGSSGKSQSEEKEETTAAKGKGKAKEVILPPTDAELNKAVAEVFKRMDIHTITFLDIVELLSERFKVDLQPRKSSIRAMVVGEVKRLSDEDGEGSSDEDGESSDDEDGEGSDDEDGESSDDEDGDGESSDDD